jgi:hypothetical protein
MSAPRRQPSGMVNVVSTAQLQGKLELYGYGTHEGAINPGDLLIICTDYITENMHRQKVEFKLRLRGEDMHLFVEASHNAEIMYVDNKHWLKAPVNGAPVDTRSLSQIRQADQIATLNAFRPK